jgi:hypothetical protein
MSDPAPGAAGDANGDGTRSATEDEFVEIYNTSPSSGVDLSGYEYEDVGVGIRHVFPAGTTVGPEQSIVVFGGGAPAPTIPGVVQTASTGTLALNNGGDSFRIVDAAGTEVLRFSYDGSTEEESLTRDPDFTGPFVAHSLAAGDGALFSPGRTAGGAPLPVELVALEGTWSRGGAQIRWVTASETGNVGFAIERRIVRSAEDAWTEEAQAEETRSQEAWTEIGFRAGAGTTSGPVPYRFVDDRFPGGARAAAYRLRQIDRDGTERLSRTVEVTRPAPSELALRGVFPNPARERATLRLDLPTRESVRAEVYDVLGRRVWTGQATGGPGPMDIALPAGRLPSGVYGIQVRASGRQATHRMVVAH